MPFVTGEFVSIAAVELGAIAKRARHLHLYELAADLDGWGEALGTCACTTELVETIVAALELNATTAARGRAPEAKLYCEAADVVCEDVAHRLLVADLAKTPWGAEQGRVIAADSVLRRRRETIGLVALTESLAGDDHGLRQIGEWLRAPSDRTMVHLAADLLRQRAAKLVPPAERDSRTTVPCPPPDAELEETVDAEAAVSSGRPTVVVHGDDVVEMVEAAAWTR